MINFMSKKESSCRSPSQDCRKRTEGNGDRRTEHVRDCSELFPYPRPELSHGPRRQATVFPVLQRRDLRFNEVWQLPKGALEQTWNSNPGLLCPESAFITFTETQSLQDVLCIFVSLHPHNNLVCLLLLSHFIETQTKTWKLRVLPNCAQPTSRRAWI